MDIYNVIKNKQIYKKFRKIEIKANKNESVIRMLDDKETGIKEEQENKNQIK